MLWKGRTFWYKRPDIPAAKRHLFFVLNDADHDEDALVLVNMTSSTKLADEACVLTPTDEDCQEITKYLVRDSYIAYGAAMVPKVKDTIAAINAGVFDPGPDVSGVLVGRIVRCVEDSTAHVPPILLDLLDEAKADSSGDNLEE